MTLGIGSRAMAVSRAVCRPACNSGALGLPQQEYQVGLAVVAHDDLVGAIAGLHALVSEMGTAQPGKLLAVGVGRHAVLEGHGYRHQLVRDGLCRGLPPHAGHMHGQPSRRRKRRANSVIGHQALRLELLEEFACERIAESGQRLGRQLLDQQFNQQIAAFHIHRLCHLKPPFSRFVQPMPGAPAENPVARGFRSSCARPSAPDCGYAPCTLRVR